MFLNKMVLNLMRVKFLFVVVLLLFAVVQVQSQYELKRKVISSGGLKAENESYIVVSTFGQPVIGQSANLDYEGKYGFWHQPSAGPIPVVMEIPLSAGWNVISSNVIPDNPSLAQVLGDITEDVLIIKNGQGQFWMPNPPPGVGNLSQWNVIDGYQIYLTESNVLTISGERASVSTPIPINGWKLVSYLPVVPLPAPVALSSIENVLVIAKNGQGEIYFPMYGINTFEQNSLTNQGMMVPTKGYMIYTAGAGVLIYDDGESFLKKIFGGDNFVQELKPKFLKLEAKNTGNNAVIVVEGGSLVDGTEIGIYNSRNELVGSGVIVQGRAPIVVWGDNEMTKEVDGLALDEALEVRAFANKDYEMPVLLTNVYEITTNYVGKSINYFPNAIYVVRIGTEEEEGVLAMQVKPNPMEERGIIEYRISEDANVKLELYDLKGQMVASFDEGWKTKGSYKLMISTQQFSSGSYNLLLRAGNSWVSRMLLINK